ncbi:MAG: selenide, water dikinase SelD [Cyanobacteriota bacterium]
MGPQPEVTPQPQQHLVLAGGGHTHALLLKRWVMDPGSRPQGVRVSLVNRGSTALYSGMVPGLVAGRYAIRDCSIDLRRLCALAGVCFVQAEITGLALSDRDLQLQERPPLRYNRLSLDVGAVTDVPAVAGHAMAVKSLEPFLAWWQHWLDHPPARPLRIRGGGAAAIELALAFASRGVTATLLLRGDTLGLGSRSANRQAETLLQRAGIAVQRRASSTAAADLACTGSRAPAWLAASGLPVDPEGSGRVLTEASLQVRGTPELFACGDCGLISGDRRPASGVWAVRAAPILAANLQRSLRPPEAALRPWRPQRWALQLLGAPGPGDPDARATADDSALAQWGPWTLGPHPWLWRWKERIDRQFMAGFTTLGTMAVRSPLNPEAAAAGLKPMACRGCAAKLAAGPLNRALARLERAEGAMAQPPQAEDALVIGTGGDGRLLLQSVDGFPALVEDPWLNARLTTLHACSDLWASGAEVATVQALVTLPEAGNALQEELLLQTLAGVRSVLDPLGATLIGGHTLEGRDGAGLALALTVNGVVAAKRHWPKGPLQPGDGLILSRPIGTGVLFAGAMAGIADSRWIDQALAVMQQSQAPLVELLASHGCRACTDITGFGLLGHLLEMLQGTRVRLDPTAVPALPGALELLEDGMASTLAPANAQALTQLGDHGPVCSATPLSTARLGLLIDPQTCGPLLAALPADQVDAALAAIRSAGFHRAAVVAEVV